MQTHVHLQANRTRAERDDEQRLRDQTMTEQLETIRAQMHTLHAHLDTAVELGSPRVPPFKRANSRARM